MNNLLRIDRLVVVAMVVIACVYLYATESLQALQIGDPLGPKAFPRLLAGGMLISAVLLLLEMRSNRKRAETAPSDEPLVEGDDAPNEKPAWTLLFVVVGWTGVYFVTFELLGYVIGTTLYLLPLTFYFNRGKWVANIVTCVLFSVLSYFAFRTLGAALPPGMLPF